MSESDGPVPCHESKFCPGECGVQFWQLTGRGLIHHTHPRFPALERDVAELRRALGTDGEFVEALGTDHEFQRVLGEVLAEAREEEKRDE